MRGSVPARRFDMCDICFEDSENYARCKSSKCNESHIVCISCITKINNKCPFCRSTYEPFVMELENHKIPDIVDKLSSWNKTPHIEHVPSFGTIIWQWIQHPTPYQRKLGIYIYPDDIMISTCNHIKICISLEPDKIIETNKMRLYKYNDLVKEINSYPFGLSYPLLDYHKVLIPYGFYNVMTDHITQPIIPKIKIIGY